MSVRWIYASMKDARCSNMIWTQIETSVWEGDELFRKTETRRRKARRQSHSNPENDLALYSFFSFPSSDKDPPEPLCHAHRQTTEMSP